MDASFAHRVSVKVRSTEIANAVTEALDNWSAAVSRALVQAQEAGQLAKAADVEALGRYLVDGYEGAATRAKFGFSRDALSLQAIRASGRTPT